MEVLLTNDDGFSAPGLQMLAEVLAEYSDEININIVAPDRERSGTGHAITINHPLRVEEVPSNNHRIRCWKVTGTPSDCVKMGIEALISSEVDLVISGINNGPNLGTDVLYSGTVSAAFEGFIYGLPALAVSLVNNDENGFDTREYRRAAQVLVELMAALYREEGLLRDRKFLLNINIPVDPGPDYTTRITSLAFRRYRDIFDKRTDPRGRSYYWLAGEVVEEEEGKNTDVTAVNAGCVSLTPLKIDLTDYENLALLQRKLEKENEEKN